MKETIETISQHPWTSFYLGIFILIAIGIISDAIVEVLKKK